MQILNFCDVYAVDLHVLCMHWTYVCSVGTFLIFRQEVKLCEKQIVKEEKVYFPCLANLNL